MSEDTPRKIVKGERLEVYPTGSHNAFYETYEKLKRLNLDQGNTGSSNSALNISVEVFNRSGSDISARFPVLELTSPTITVDDNSTAYNLGMAFEGDTPSSDTKITDIAILQGPVNDDAAVDAVLSGPTWCQVYMTDADHGYAQPKADDDTQLESAESGIRILWSETPSPPETVWALVLMGPSQPARFKSGFLDESLAFESSATMSVCYYDGSDNRYNTSDNIEVWDVILNSGDSIDAYTRITAMWNEDSSRYEVVSGNCTAATSETVPQVEE